tara:strand:- start:644 stop:766 length:123 start_codon:yes stop_codon:yes gene_type:complete
MKDYKVPPSLEEYAEKVIFGMSYFIIGLLALVGALSLTGL